MGGCEGETRGFCTEPTANQYPLQGCELTTPTLTRACLCDQTEKEILLDCSGVYESFKNLGACQ